MPTIRSKITGKLSYYRFADARYMAKFPEENAGLTTINSSEGLEIIEKCGKICPGCGCKMKFKNYGPWCLYQFTFDRIDNKKIHSKDNLVLSCYNCNASGYGAPKIGCKKGCHGSDYDSRIELIMKTILEGGIVPLTWLKVAKFYVYGGVISKRYVIDRGYIKMRTSIMKRLKQPKKCILI